METKPDNLNRKIRNEWLLVAGGGLLLLIGIGAQRLIPAAATNFKVVISLGILIAGWAVGMLARDLTLRRYPEAARRAAIEERDERMQSIRDRAGSRAFQFMMGVAIIALLIYSAISRNVPEPDLLWFFMAFLVLGPGLAYIGYLVYYQEKY